MKVLFWQRCQWAALIMALFVSTGYAGNNEEAKTFNCSEDIFKGAYLTKLEKLRTMNIAYSVKICKQLLALDKKDITANVNYILSNMATENKKVIKKYFSDQDLQSQLSTLFDEFMVVSIQNPIETKKLGELRTQPGENGSDTVLYFNTSSEKRITFTPDDNEKCSQIGGVEYRSCKAALKDISIAFNAYRKHYANYVTVVNEVLLDDMSYNWTKFLDNARSQTLLDVWATTFINSSHYKKDHLVSPAEVQYFLAHPGLVYEHVDNAPAGEKDKVSLAMEWIGFNFWNHKVPWGASWVTTYSDRQDISSVGQGVMVYLDNKYSFGWVHRSDSDGYFISVDLLKAFSDKKQQLEQYKNMF
jgi:hypothetical protein